MRYNLPILVVCIFLIINIILGNQKIHDMKQQLCKYEAEYCSLEQLLNHVTKGK